jgi:hypothetical protein
MCLYLILKFNKFYGWSFLYGICFLVVCADFAYFSHHYLCGKLQVVVKASKVYPKDPEAPPCGVDDMTKLAYLHEPGVLDNLRSRYDINEIYVSIWNRLSLKEYLRKLVHHRVSFPFLSPFFFFGFFGFFVLVRAVRRGKG